MESTQIQTLYEPPLAAMPQLSEKPRQGFETRKQAWHPGLTVCNFTVTLGLQATVVENGVRGTYSARYYNPNTGRFMSRDPFAGYLDDPATLHRYLYTENDPVNRIDPRGRADMFETGLTLDKIAKATTLTVARLGVEVALCLFGIAETIHEFEDGNNGWGTASGAATLVACALPFVPHPPSPPGPPAPPEPPTPPPPPEPPCLNILICGGGGKGPRPPGFTY